MTDGEKKASSSWLAENRVLLSPTKPAHKPLWTSPLIDISNKQQQQQQQQQQGLLVSGSFSPQTELTVKLQLTSLNNNSSTSSTNQECNNPHRIHTNENSHNHHRHHHLSSQIATDKDRVHVNDKHQTATVKSSSWSVQAEQQKGNVEASPHQPVAYGRLSDKNGVPVQIKDGDLAEHFVAPLIKSAASVTTQLKRSVDHNLKRLAGESSLVVAALQSSNKKIKGPLQAVKECSPPSLSGGRLRSGSEPTPFNEGGTSSSSSSNTNNNNNNNKSLATVVEVTPTKSCNNSTASQADCPTPISIRNRQQKKVQRRPASGLPVGRSMVALESFDLVRTAPERNEYPSPSRHQKQTALEEQLRECSNNSNNPTSPVLIGDMSKGCLLSCRLFDGMPLVDCDEVARLLEGVYASEVERAFIIDCRFPYEFAGGHIRGANNFPYPFTDKLKATFFSSKSASQVSQASWSRSKDGGINTTGSRVIIIFHCEFSSHRAPNTFRWFRTEDRNAHTIANYPQLDYPEAYVLRGGYKAFVNYCQQAGKLHLCDPPGGYTEQRDPKFVDYLRHVQRRIRTTIDIENCMSDIENCTLSEPSGESQLQQCHNNRCQNGVANQHQHALNNLGVEGHRNESCADLRLLVQSDDGAAGGNNAEESTADRKVGGGGDRKTDFDDDDFSSVKMNWLKKEMSRRRSECPPNSFKPAIGRASFEELSAPSFVSGDRKT